MKKIGSPSLALAFVLLLAGATGTSFAIERPGISATDAPVRIIRGATVFKAGAGVGVQNDDIVETAAGAAQIEASPDLMIALAPETRIYLKGIQGSAPARSEITVLSGWIKVANKVTGANGQVSILSPRLQVGLGNGASVVHAAAARDELFPGKRTAPDLKVGREQYLLQLDGQAAKVLPRVPRDFVTAMPLAFRDPLAAAPDRSKGVKALAVKEREADYADVAPWLKSNLALKKSLVKRFMPRLSDPAFRAALDAELGTTPDWKSILHPPAPPAAPVTPKPASAPNSDLF